MTRRPFYPAQTPTGETYVVDGRTNTIVRTIASSFDTTERWSIAKRDAAKRNAAHVQRTYAVRQRTTLGCLTLLVVLFVLELATGDLSRLVDGFISLTR